MNEPIATNERLHLNLRQLFTYMPRNNASHVYVHNYEYPSSYSINSRYCHSINITFSLCQKFEKPAFPLDFSNSPQKYQHELLFAFRVTLLNFCNFCLRSNRSLFLLNNLALQFRSSTSSLALPLDEFCQNALLKNSVPKLD